MSRTLSLVKSPALRICLIIAGWVAVTLGVLGIVLPLLPTTPFLLLAAACFARSSARFHDWLLNHRYLGPYIHYYLDGKGIPRRAKIIAIALMWVTMGVSMMIVPLMAVRIILPLIAISVTFYLLRLPTLETPPSAQ